MLHLWNKKYSYSNLSRVTDKAGGRFYTSNGEKVPSVTTILDKTKSQKDKDSLIAWKEKVGYREASRISKESMSRGDKMHKYLEDAIHGTRANPQHAKRAFAYSLLRDRVRVLFVRFDVVDLVC